MTETSPLNPLRVRLVLSKSLTRQVQGIGKDLDWEKVTATIETDKPQGIDALEALKQLDATLTSYLSTVNVSTAIPQPQQPEKVKTSPTIENIDLSIFETAKRNKKGAPWIPSDEHPQLKQLLAASEKHSLDIGSYHLSMDPEARWITRWGTKK